MFYFAVLTKAKQSIPVNKTFICCCSNKLIFISHWRMPAVNFPNKVRNKKYKEKNKMNFKISEFCCKQVNNWSKNKINANEIENSVVRERDMNTFCLKKHKRSARHYRKIQLKLMSWKIHFWFLSSRVYTQRRQRQRHEKRARTTMQQGNV